ncbi:hypothetical protein RHMOL_Rhmol10G0087200 [Rhododendron molle]|uniref:Uncharacterized protein n=1 Tax=Rhododendron molle TaxID=49168 RepID=A0ACC0M1F1_RHOML|nr:hypothetical protein RHMOL_Rhmol10G0087200 [Rhododendron molle]
MLAAWTFVVDFDGKKSQRTSKRLIFANPRKALHLQREDFTLKVERLRQKRDDVAIIETTTKTRTNTSNTIRMHASAKVPLLLSFLELRSFSDFFSTILDVTEPRRIKELRFWIDDEVQTTNFRNVVRRPR